MCLRWLATGQLPRSPFTPILEKILDEAGAGTSILFSASFDRTLNPIVKARLESIARSQKTTVEGLDYIGFRDFHPAGGSAAEGHLEQVVEVIKQQFAKMDDDQQMRFVRRLIDIPASIWKNWEVEYKDILDSKSPTGSVTDMSLEVPTWAQLKKQIAKLTSAHGKKAALADELGVSRQVLGNWLSSDDQGTPNAELTLRLLKWVRDPKRQVK